MTIAHFLELFFGLFFVFLFGFSSIWTIANLISGESKIIIFLWKLIILTPFRFLWKITGRRIWKPKDMKSDEECEAIEEFRFQKWLVKRKLLQIFLPLTLIYLGICWHVIKEDSKKIAEKTAITRTERLAQLEKEIKEAKKALLRKNKQKTKKITTEKPKQTEDKINETNHESETNN